MNTEFTEKLEGSHVKTNGHVLIVDDDESIRALYHQKISSQGYVVECAASLKSMMSLVEKNKYDAILLDLILDNENALEVLPQLLSHLPQAAIVVLTGHQDIEYAVSAISKGASDFLIKSDSPDRNVEKFLDAIKPKAEPGTGDFDLSSLGIIGQSDVIKAIGEKIFRLKSVDSTVLITGESGTGKEVIARAIHQLSQRSGGPFLGINCAALSESILESELFGYRRGAFTDAKKDRKGFFETCNNGTLLLDEIGEMSLGLQAKILRVIQEKEVTPLGSCHSVPINTRILASTNRILEREVEKKNFRADLYYRLAVIQIKVPALRHRKTDIPLLANHFLEQFNRRFDKSIPPLTIGMQRRLMAYQWPGNIRELHNAMERAVVLAADQQLHIEDLLPYRELKEHHDLDQSPSLCLADLPLSYNEAKNEFEKYYIENLLTIAGGNIAEASRLGGQYRPNLYRLIHKFDIDPHQFKLKH